MGSDWFILFIFVVIFSSLERKRDKQRNGDPIAQKLECVCVCMERAKFGGFTMIISLTIYVFVKYFCIVFTYATSRTHLPFSLCTCNFFSSLYDSLNWSHTKLYFSIIVDCTFGKKIHFIRRSFTFCAANVIKLL